MTKTLTAKDIARNILALKNENRLPHAARAMEHVITMLKSQYGKATTPMIVEVCSQPEYKSAIEDLPAFPGERSSVKL